MALLIQGSGPRRTPDELKAWAIEFRMLRKKLGYTQAKAASILELGSQTVANWEAARARPWDHQAILRRIAASAALPTQQLVADTPTRAALHAEIKPDLAPRKRRGRKAKVQVPSESLSTGVSAHVGARQAVLLAGAPGLISRRRP